MRGRSFALGEIFMSIFQGPQKVWNLTKQSFSVLYCSSCGTANRKPMKAKARSGRSIMTFFFYLVWLRGKPDKHSLVLFLQGQSLCDTEASLEIHQSFR